MFLDEMYSDFDWVLRILSSSETISHLEVSNKCFLLWENKYLKKNTKKGEEIMMAYLRSRFLSKLSKKTTKIQTNAYLSTHHSK
jgi:hypothetical protein